MADECFVPALRELGVLISERVGLCEEAFGKVHIVFVVNVEAHNRMTIPVTFPWV